MTHNARVHAFLEEIKKLSDFENIGIATTELLAEMGFTHFACCSHVDYKMMPYGGVLLHNYPDEWSETFREMHLEQYDPIQRFAERSLLPFHWNNLELVRSLNQKQAQILDQASRFGLKRGYTVPIHTPGHFTASLSVAGLVAEMDHETLTVVHFMAPFLYHRLHQIVYEEGVAGKVTTLLSENERLFLSLVAQGKSDWAIAQICGTTPSAVTHSIERVRNKFGVSTRMQAVAIALLRGHLAFEQAIGRTTSLTRENIIIQS